MNMSDLNTHKVMVSFFLENLILTMMLSSECGLIREHYGRKKIYACQRK